MDNQKRSLDWIQALRGIAALGVVLCHSRNFYKGTPDWSVAERWMLPGAIGVDLFFMLSGFIMVYSTINYRPTLRYTVEFLIKRFARVWPAYAIFTLAWTIFTHIDADFLPLWSLLVAFKSLIFLPVKPHPTMYYGTALPVGWTLNFEIYFYIVFGFCLLFRKFRWVALFAWMFTTLVLLPWLHGSLSMDISRGHEFPILYLDLMANPIIAEFLIGVLIGLAYLNERMRFSTKKVSYFIAILATTLAVTYTWLYQGPLHGLRNWGWPIAIFLLCVTIASKTVTFKVPKTLSFVGEISFSLYLVHDFVHRAGKILVENFDSIKQVNVSVLVITMAALSLWLAKLSHQFIEQGLSNKIRDQLLYRWLPKWTTTLKVRFNSKESRLAKRTDGHDLLPNKLNSEPTPQE